MHPIATVSIAHLCYPDLSPAELERLLLCVLCEGKRPFCVFTPNATIAAAAARDASLTALLQSADLLLPDGRGVLLASQLCRTPLRYRLPGIDAGECVLRICARRGLPVYLLGAAPGVARRAAEMWRERLPALPVAGWHHGFFPAEENPHILRHIRESGAVAVLVCLGFPAQERWIVQNAPLLPEVRLLMGLGGSLDVWSGRVRRAPALWQRAGLEWLWRSVRAPRRLRTLLPVFPFLLTCARQNTRKDTNPSQFARQNLTEFSCEQSANYAKRQK